MIFSNRIQNYYLKVGTRRDNGFRIRRFRAQCIKTWKARNMHIPFVCPSVRPHLSHENPLSKLQWVFLHKSQSNTLVVPPNYPVFFRPTRKFRLTQSVVWKIPNIGIVLVQLETSILASALYEMPLDSLSKCAPISPKAYGSFASSWHLPVHR